MFARQFAHPPHRFRLLARALLGGFLIMVAQLDLPKHPLTLELALQRSERLLNIIITHNHLYRHRLQNLKQSKESKKKNLRVAFG